MAPVARRPAAAPADPSSRGYLKFGGFVIDPEGEHNLYFAHDTMAIVKYDAKTGNVYTFSL